MGHTTAVINFRYPCWTSWSRPLTEKTVSQGSTISSFVAVGSVMANFVKLGGVSSKIGQHGEPLLQLRAQEKCAHVRGHLPWHTDVHSCLSVCTSLPVPPCISLIIPTLSLTERMIS